VGVQGRLHPAPRTLPVHASTANPHHLTLPIDGTGRDTLPGLRSVGTDTQRYAGGTPQFDTPNHNYDISDFDQLVAAIATEGLPPSALPAVSFLKTPGYRDGHAGYSDPEDEHNWRLRDIDGSADQVLASRDRSEGIAFDLAGAFDFRGPPNDRLILDPTTGQPARGGQAEQ
ncbi:MAG: phosphoesterase, partial [Chloroflexi bacterium]|jgi:hypothetical protein|nr:phosphoesterase [Chloroflexota bacterium]